MVLLSWPRSVAVAVVGLIAAAACAGSSTNSSTNLAPPDKQILRVNDVTEPNSYDPTQQTFSYEGAVGRQVFQALLRPKADLSDVEPSAAQSYSVSADGLTYTFHLRTNARWSDGKPVTASDWVYGYKHFLNPALAAGYVDPFFDGTIKGADGYGNVDVTNVGQIDRFLSGLGLAAPDANTFVITLQHPAPYFKWVVSLWVAVPLREDIVEQAAGGTFPSTDTTKPEAWANNPQTIVGNGPFKISEMVAKDHTTLVPNPNYWGGAAHIQQLVYYYISDGNTSFSKYQTGALDIINVPVADVTVVRGDPTLSKQAHLFPELTTFWMVYNSQEKPFDSPDVRMAFAKSIDRNKLTRDVLHGTDKPIQSFFPKGMNGYDTSDNAQSFDPAAAKALLQKAGVNASQLNKFKLLTRNTSNNKTINQYIADQWKSNLGVNIQLDVIDSKTVTRNLRKGQFDIYGPDGWAADYPDQQDFADIFTSGSCHSLNWGCVANNGGLKGYDDLVKRADTETNQSQRNQDYLQAQKMLIDQAAVGFIYQQYEYDLIQTHVQYSWSPFDDEYTPGDQNYSAAAITSS